jgi:hypothetical protein
VSALSHASVLHVCLGTTTVHLCLGTTIVHLCAGTTIVYLCVGSIELLMCQYRLGFKEVPVIKMNAFIEIQNNHFRTSDGMDVELTDRSSRGSTVVFP